MQKPPARKPDEEDDDGDDDEDAPRRTVGANHITLEGFRTLERELDHLWKVERPKITEEVSVAAAQGDRSENAQYIYGKKKLREIDRRVRFLTKRLESVTVVGPREGEVDTIYFGAWFSFEDEDGAEFSYRIVGTDEIDLAKKKISIKSPLAQALLGKRTGDAVVVARPKGPTEVTVTRVWYA